MAIPPSNCSIFIQIWVDTNALQAGSQSGVYCVDNNFSHGSTNEGTTSLVTNTTTGTNICWSVLNTNPNAPDVLTIQNFSNASVFGAGGTPKMVNANTWTGTVQNAGTATYSITFNDVNGTGITTTVSGLSLVVTA